MIDTKQLKRYLQREFPGVTFRVYKGDSGMVRPVFIGCYGGDYLEQLKYRLYEYLVANNIRPDDGCEYSPPRIQYHTEHGTVAIDHTEQPPPPVLSRRVVEVTKVKTAWSNVIFDRIFVLECGHLYEPGGEAAPKKQYRCHHCEQAAAEQYERERLEIIATLTNMECK